MKITVTSILPHPSGLVLGLRVEHEKAGWIRFATTVLLIDAVNDDACATLTDALNKRWSRTPPEEDMGSQYLQLF